MKIVIAPDSYKGSLSAIKVSEAMKKAVMHVDSNIAVSLKPMADGGEGTLDCLLHTTKSTKIPIICTGPTGLQQQTYYGITDEKVALIEMANIAGLEQVRDEERHPANTTTYGIGEVIIDAYTRGCRKFIVGLGGSATNDGGLGMFQALGMKAYDSDGNELTGFGKDILEIDSLDTTFFKKWQDELEIQVACDVDNPLCGSRGATAVYGPQKGILPEQVKQYDEALDKYSNLIEKELKVSYKNIAGAGAAGGLGFALLSLGAQLVSGAKLISEMIDLEAEIKGATFVITGEGQSDEQTLYGKAPSYIANLANKYDVPTILISGALGNNSDELLKIFAACFSIANKPLTINYCIENAEQLIYEQTKQIINLVSKIKN